MKLLSHDLVDRNYLLKVHLDETKVLEDGSPDPAWVSTYIWGSEAPLGVDATDYYASQEREALLSAAVELAGRS